MLNSAQLRYLRGLAQALKPIVMLGDKGLTDAVVKELDKAIAHHELVKVKIADDDRAQRKALAEQLAEKTRSELVQTIGKQVCLYRPNAEQRKIQLPRK